MYEMFQQESRKTLPTDLTGISRLLLTPGERRAQRARLMPGERRRERKSNDWGKKTATKDEVADSQDHNG